MSYVIAGRFNCLLMRILFSCEILDRRKNLSFVESKVKGFSKILKSSAPSLGYCENTILVLFNLKQLKLMVEVSKTYFRW